MDNPQVFNNYDIRGIYPDEINEELTMRLGRAIGTYANGLVVVGGDTREMTPALKKALILGLRSSGSDVIDVGIGPTDLITIAGAHYNAILSVMITASHHGWDRNGFKLMYAKGNGFSNEDMAVIKKIYADEPFVDAETGSYENKEDEFRQIYTKRAIDCFKKHFDSIDAKVIVDCANGGAAVVLPDILLTLGAEVVKVNCDFVPDKNVAPEPEEESRTYLVDALKANNADIAVGCDPDADRVFAFDSNGRWVNGDEIFAMLAKVIGAKKISASLDTSSMLFDATGADITLTRVGDIFVSKKAIDIDADFMGEPNGHYAFPDFSWYNSGTFAALILAANAKKLSSMIDSLPKYFTANKKFKYDNDEMKILATKKAIVDAGALYFVISDLDGVKFKCDDAVVLIRPSGTSPVIRIKAEAKTQQSADLALEKASLLL
ncbi:MAG: hypothetical protein KAS12_03940 [Candidatus Aenigmarchaeota archaeon]|nr:hypothetical protein [Candidatus Aenigmarchaeota archaeon]